MSKTVYVVIMYRYGNVGGHSYVLGVFSTEYKAQKHGDIEKIFRGGKYDPKAIEYEIDKDPE